MAGTPISNGHPGHIAAAVRAADIELGLGNEPEFTGPERKFLVAAGSEEVMLCVHRILSIAVAGMQLAARQDGLQTVAEKLAVATIASNALAHISALSTLAGSLQAAAEGNTSQMIGHDFLKTAALGLGIASGSLVMADPASNHISGTHDNLVKAGFAFAGAAVMLGLCKWINYAKIR